DAGLPQGVAVETDPLDPAPLERRAQPPERRTVLVDDSDVVALLLEADRQGGPPPTRAPDHEVHDDNIDGPGRTPSMAVRVDGRTCPQAVAGGPALHQRQARRNPAPQADPPAGLRQ